MSVLNSLSQLGLLIVLSLITHNVPVMQTLSPQYLKLCQISSAGLSLWHAGMRLPGIYVTEAPCSVQGGGVPLMSTRVTPAVSTAERE